VALVSGGGFFTMAGMGTVWGMAGGELRSWMGMGTVFGALGMGVALTAGGDSAGVAVAAGATCTGLSGAWLQAETRAAISSTGNTLFIDGARAN